MRIQELKLFTNTLDSEKVFYLKTLGLKIIDDTPTSFTIKTGWSKLTFEKSDKEHIYHYCFLIPSNKLTEALEWMKKKVEIIDLGKGKRTHQFKDWNADSFYFYDASGNIVEFIARHELNYIKASNFDISDIICINEIGMPTNNIKEMSKQLKNKFGTNFWKGDTERFGTNGSPKGLFLLPNYEVKKSWFPTLIKIKSEPFEIVLKNNNKRYFMEYRNGEIK